MGIGTQEPIGIGIHRHRNMFAIFAIYATGDQNGKNAIPTRFVRTQVRNRKCKHCLGDFVDPPCMPKARAISLKHCLPTVGCVGVWRGCPHLNKGLHENACKRISKCMLGEVCKCVRNVYIVSKNLPRDGCFCACRASTKHERDPSKVATKRWNCWSPVWISAFRQGLAWKRLQANIEMYVWRWVQVCTRCIYSIWKLASKWLYLLRAPCKHKARAISFKHCYQPLDLLEYGVDARIQMKWFMQTLASKSRHVCLAMGASVPQMYR